MTALRNPKMTVDDYLAWGLTQPGGVRADLIDGVVHAQAPERLKHIRLKIAAVIALADGITKAGLHCHAVGDGATVRISETTAFEPDALVYCGAELPGDSVEVPTPVIVVEVLSPGSEGRDMRDKLAGYFELSSVAHYLILDPDERLLIHHARQSGDTLTTRILRDGALRLDPPGLTIEVGGLFK